MATSRQHSSAVRASAATLALTLAACGVGGSLGPTAAGQVVTEAPVGGTVTLMDSSTPMQSRSAPAGPDGSFAVPVAGLETPYLLRVGWTDSSGPHRLYAVSEGNDDVDVNGLTDVAYGGACTGQDEEQLFWTSTPAQKRGVAERARAWLARLGAALAPLLERYGITDPRTDRDAVRALLKDVSIVRRDGSVLVTNRATGGVVFQGPLVDPGQGTFTAASMPAGPTVPCTAFTYSAYGACQPDGTRTRTVLASTPAGCTGGAPVTMEPCTYVPPPPTCAGFTYSDYGACQPDGTRTRTVLASTPAGCTGGAPITSQPCIYVPPIDGAALYTQYCAGCHGDSKKGSSVSKIERAIKHDTGGMGTAALRALTEAQLAAISAAP